MLDRLVWAEINLNNYRYNFLSLKKVLKPGVRVMAVVKANAYGHGITGIAKAASSMGIRFFGVVCMHEAKLLRSAGIRSRILLMNYSDTDSLDQLIRRKITVTVIDRKILAALDKTARKYAQKIPMHVKIDTGMHRLGISPEEALKFIPAIEEYKNLYLEGMFTHFATADEKDLDFTKEQLVRFNGLVEELKRKNIRIPLIHTANSAASLRLPESHFSMVRPGIILYGLKPSGDFRIPFKPKPILSLKTKVVQIRRLPKGETVGYGRTYKSERTILMATLPVGYGDGFRRAPNHWSHVLVRGKQAPVIGRISMDQTTIDISRITGCRIGDEVVLIGKQKNAEITADDIGRQLGTINYEVVTSLSERVSRKYIG